MYFTFPLHACVTVSAWGRMSQPPLSFTLTTARQTADSKKNDRSPSLTWFWFLFPCHCLSLSFSAWLFLISTSNVHEMRWVTIPRQRFSINLSVSDFIWHELTHSEIILCVKFLWINQCKCYANWIRLNLSGRWFLYCSNTDCNSTCCQLAVNMCLCVCCKQGLHQDLCVEARLRSTLSVNNIIPTRIMSYACVFVLWEGLF